MLTCGAIKPVGTSDSKKGTMNMSDIFIFICGAVLSMVFFILGAFFGAAAKFTITYGTADSSEEDNDNN